MRSVEAARADIRPAVDVSMAAAVGRGEVHAGEAGRTSPEEMADFAVSSSTTEAEAQDEGVRVPSTEMVLLAADVRRPDHAGVAAGTGHVTSGGKGASRVDASETECAGSGGSGGSLCSPNEKVDAGPTPPGGSM